ncbi:MAG: RNA polymerase sigma-54 factor, partial [Saprospiraceae bacterium]|nr:RNA polymerase sigma-54 factor [Saprospiraceae bacterium]
MLQKLSPQQIQLMKLLQIPTANLEERIKEELEANPALDEGDDAEKNVFDLESEGYNSSEGETSGDHNDEKEFEFDDYLNEYLEDDPASYKMKGDDFVDEEERRMPVPVENT